MHLNVAPELLKRGMASAAVVVRGLDNTRTSPELIAYRRQAGKALAAFWKSQNVSTHPVLREYHRLHEECGVADEPAAPEKLIMYVRRNQDFTGASALVDCYNIVSVKTLLSIGAHDLARLATPVTLRTCQADDRYIPLGQTTRQEVAGEYGYVDAAGQVICRMEVLQGDGSKTTRDSRDVIFFLQGNRCLSPAVLLKGAWYLAEVLERFVGGQAELVDFHDPGDTRAVVETGKPRVAFEQFSGLNLCKGTLTSVAPLATMPALSVATIRAVSDVRALVPSCVLSADSTGQAVVVATGLHPVRAAGQAFDAYVLSASGPTTASLLAVDAAVPDGLKLY